MGNSNSISTPPHTNRSTDDASYHLSSEAEDCSETIIVQPTTIDSRIHTQPSHESALSTAIVSSNDYTHTSISSLYYVIQSVPYALSNSFVWVSNSVKHLFVGQEYDKNKVVDAIEKLQSTLTFLDTKINRLNENVVKYTSEAKRLYASKNKPAAIHQLRLKKMYEREISKMDSLKFNIESNILHMESVGVMMETVSTIKETSHQFQIVSRHVDINKLEDSIEEMFEQRDTSKDIENILNDMHDAHDYDEDELMEELESLVSDTHDAPPAKTAETTTTTSSSTHPPPEAPPQTMSTIILNMPEAPSTAILDARHEEDEEEMPSNHTQDAHVITPTPTPTHSNQNQKQALLQPI